jgi:uncharacterized 2Fe-2S/4Fe-4S cluster protein (DUF4445 family)
MPDGHDSDTVRVVFQPVGVTVEVARGDTLFRAAADLGVEIDTVCGGSGLCGKCKVRVVEPQMVPAKPIDHIHLHGDEVARGFRLSCQLEPVSDLVVEVPPARNRSVRILHHGESREVPIRPNVLKVHIPYTPPRQRDGVADWDAVRSLLPAWFSRVEVPLHWLRRLPALIRDERGMTLTIVGRRRVTRIVSGDSTVSSYGIAVDIGSTSVVGYLVNLDTGEEVGHASGMNRQAAYGDDIIGRLSRAQFSEEGLARMHELLIEQLNEVFADLVRSAGIDLSEIDEVTVVGNIAGFVGSDTVGVILAGGLADAERPMMAVDVGTNGEVVLGWKKRMIACSAPAGPAFEGARISQGMRATTGAVDHVEIDGDVKVSVIDGVAPAGICGSALIDIGAGLLRAGVLHHTGRMLRHDELGSAVPDAVRDRLIDGATRKDAAFVLVRRGEMGNDEPIVFTQQDVREFQLAKGAIRAGEMVLQGHAGVTDDELGEVVLAGAFGSYIDLENARDVNLVPHLPLERLRSVGNAAGAGARLALVSTSERKRAEKVAESTEHVRLSGLAEFQTAFTHAMRFPKPDGGD